MTEATQTPAPPAPSSAPTAPRAPLSTLAVVACVLSFIPCASLIGVILGLIALGRIRKSHGALRGRGPALVAVIFPLAAVPVAVLAGLPAYNKFQCGAKQTEAQFNLKAIANLQRFHVSDKGAYAPDTTTLAFTPGDAEVRYRYRIIDASKDAFHAEAEGFGEMAGDKWTIDDTAPAPVNVANVCD